MDSTLCAQYDPQAQHITQQDDVLDIKEEINSSGSSNFCANGATHEEKEIKHIDIPSFPVVKQKKPITKIKIKKPRIYGDSSYDPTKLEDSPAQVLERFKYGCECQDDRCFKGLNAETVYRHRLNIAELTKAEHDMYLMGVTMACLTNPYQTARHTERRRLRAQYVYQGRRVCLDAFLYLENCTHYQIKRIRKHLITHGVTPRVHGNHGKVPHNTFSLDIYKIATEFLKNFIEVQEAKQKAKVAKNAPLHLSADITRKTVHDLYTQYCREISPDIKIMGYSTFRRFMKVQFPQVKFAKLEFVVRGQTMHNQGCNKVETGPQKTEEPLNETTELMAESETLPLLITNETGQNSTYFLTPVNKLQYDDVESMTGEIENGDLAVRDVADLLQSQYAIIAGGKTRDGCPIITFPDNGNFHNLTDLDYQRLMLYLTSVPTLQEADLGFHLIIDRRNDKWNSVKTVLLKISAFFPGLVHVAYVLRPAGFLQKAISEVSNKLFREDFKFRVIFLANVAELYDFIEKDQLTEQLGGNLPYCHHTWIQNRISLEKFSSMTQDVSLALDSFTRRLAEIEFPNNTVATTTLLSQQQAEYNELKEEILSAARHGEALLDSVRQLTGKGTADRLGNVAAVERLLVQLEETERTFDLFWSHHSSRLRHCLALRQFEADFRELQTTLDQHLKTVEEMTEVGETTARVEQLLCDTSAFQRICRGDIDRAEEVISAGQQLLSGRHQCPADVVEPKCVELQRICTILSQRLERRLLMLTKCRELMERIDKANAWCTRGIEMLASQNSTTPADQALQELQELIEAAEEFHHPRCIFQDSIMPETKALITQVLQRIEDVSLMCDKRIMALKQQLIKPARPVQTVTPEPVKPLQSLPQTVKPGRILKKANTMPKMEMSPIEGEASSPESEPRDVEGLRLKRGHVLAELVETERIYVAELGSIIKGYKMELMNEAMAHLIPAALVGKADVLFGNLEDIYIFHGETFLRDLENCISNTELVALCFVQRREVFFRLYSYYCQNIPRSERLREQIQNEPQFLVACQQRLGHKLPLAAYLLKPVQRITKYQLLLKDLLKYSDEPSCCTELQEALDGMLVVLKCVNDSMHQTAITGFGGDLSAQGELLLQGSFSVWSSSKRERLLRLKPSQRHIFLYEKALIFCKHSKPQAHNKATYHFKRYLKMSQIGLTESVKGDARRFEIWLQGRAEVHTIQASSIDVKQSWVRQIKGVLMSQLAELKGKQNSALGKSNHKPLRQTISWEAQSSVSGSLRTLSVDGSSVISHITDASQATEDDVAWSSENSNTDDEDAFSENPGPAPGGRYVALADYCAVGQSEVTMREGDNLELLKVGCAGWWFVKLVGSGVEGWAPAAYLEPISRKTSRSSQSVNSQEAI
ncbi:hypothetical protein KM043_014246 [Ampulex compressa]|nr:hypothetical protein KM043_014246 [Ampulex compressa]